MSVKENIHGHIQAAQHRTALKFQLVHAYLNGEGRYKELAAKHKGLHGGVSASAFGKQFGSDSSMLGEIYRAGCRSSPSRKVMLNLG
ncbi:hypothetical protein LP416_02790 [Polaromonas sp. P2-4]|nr:hypothetical protein LP416_02790 [Polaromonas sp. P2-4]